MPKPPIDRLERQRATPVHKGRPIDETDPLILVIVLSNGDAFDLNVESNGEINNIVLAWRSDDLILATKWRKNNNPPKPTGGPFTEDNPLTIAASMVVYMATNGGGA